MLIRFVVTLILNIFSRVSTRFFLTLSIIQLQSFCEFFRIVFQDKLRTLLDVDQILVAQEPAEKGILAAKWFSGVAYDKGDRLSDSLSLVAAARLRSHTQSRHQMHGHRRLIWAQIEFF